MQAFLPYSDFTKSAACLDNRRLSKQRVEVLQILLALTGQYKGWTNHPATKMWRGYEVALGFYGLECCKEWRSRGFKDACEEKINEILDGLSCECIMPNWFGDEAFHASHRSNLLRKDVGHYGRFGWTEADDLPYVWPAERKN